MTDTDNQPPSKRAREASIAYLDTSTSPTPPLLGMRADIVSGAGDHYQIVQAFAQFERTLLDEIEARVRGLLVDDPNWIEAGVPDAAIEAGIAAWDQAKHDMENYVSGETADWDEGMIVAAIFKAVGRASILAAIDTIQGRE